MGENLRMTAAEARARILRNQGLAPQSSNSVEAVGRCFGVQTQYAVSLPVSVAARTVRQRRGWDQKALESGELVKSWTLRQTIHVHTPDDHRLALEAFGARRRKLFEGWMQSRIAAANTTLESLELRILDALADGPLTRKQIHESVPEYKSMTMVGWGLDVMGLAYQGRIVLLTPPKGATLFKRVDPPVLLRQPNEATADLMMRYFQTHGPATLADFSYWAGLPVGQTKEAFERIRGELQGVSVEGHAGDRYMVKSDEAAPSMRGLRFLAKFDPLLMGYKDKSLFLDPLRQKDVFRKAGQVEATVLESGKVTGTWRLERSGSSTATVVVNPFSVGCLRRRADAERQLSHMAVGLGLKEIEISLNPN